MSYFSLSRRLLRSISALRSASLPLLSQPVSSSFSSPSLLKPTENPLTRLAISSRLFCSRPMDLDEGQIPASIDYRSLIEEDEYHKLADTTINDLQEKFEEYGDDMQLDGFDIDYGNQVLTLKLGDLGTYVLNKQTPNRQIWLSSPVSGPSRFDWDRSTHAWVYRRTKVNLIQLLESEMEQLCGKPISLS